MPRRKDMKCVNIEYVSGCEGNHIEIANKDGGTRIAGPKAWGVGRVIESFTVTVEALLEAIKENEYED
jgi:hypothetical protein